MISIAAYYNGNNFVTEKNVIVKQNQKVIITILDDFIPSNKKKSLEDIRSYMGIGGKSKPDNINTVEYIKSLRED